MLLTPSLQTVSSTTTLARCCEQEVYEKGRIEKETKEGNIEQGRLYAFQIREKRIQDLKVFRLVADSEQAKEKSDIQAVLNPIPHPSH